MHILKFSTSLQLWNMAILQTVYTPNTPNTSESSTRNLYDNTWYVMIDLETWIFTRKLMRVILNYWDVADEGILVGWIFLNISMEKQPLEMVFSTGWWSLATTRIFPSSFLFIFSLCSLFIANTSAMPPVAIDMTISKELDSIMESCEVCNSQMGIIYTPKHMLPVPLLTLIRWGTILVCLCENVRCLDHISWIMSHILYIGFISLSNWFPNFCHTLSPEFRDYYRVYYFFNLH